MKVRRTTHDADGTVADRATRSMQRGVAPRLRLLGDDTTDIAKTPRHQDTKEPGTANGGDVVWFAYPLCAV